MRYSLRAGLLAIAGCCILSACVAPYIRGYLQERRSISVLSGRGAYIEYEVQRPGSLPIRLSGLDLHRAVFVQLAPTATDIEMRNTARLLHLRVLLADGTQITDGGMRYAAELIDLRTLDISGTAVTDQGISHAGSFVALESINISGSGASFQAVIQSQVFPRVNRICLDAMQLRQAASSLKSMEAGRFETLELSGQDVTDDCFRLLSQPMPFRKLVLIGTRVTDLGIEEFRARNRAITVYVP